MYVVEFLFVTIARMQSTAYCRSKDSPTDIFLEELIKEEFSFSLPLQTYNPELLTSVKKDLFL